jgi:hypothetical protein
MSMRVELAGRIVLFLATAGVAASLLVAACDDSQSSPPATDASVPDSAFVPPPPGDSSVDAGGPDGACLLDGSLATTCGAGCVDTQADPSHCGGCSKACDAGAVCSQSACTDVAGSLAGARWSLPCTAAPDMSNVCTTGAAQVQTAVLNGTPGKAYDVTLRFRGFVEQKTYTGGSDAGVAAVGTNASLFLTGGTDNGDGFNVYRLAIDQPAQTFHLNAGTSSIYYCFALDFTATVRMNGGATVTLTADPKDGAILGNKDADGGSIVVTGVPPAPAAFDGQFVQMDVVSVKPAP